MSTSGTHPTLSIVSPVYRAEEIVPELVKRLVETMEGLGETFEIILVEDASPDQSWGAVEAVCQQESRVIGVKLSRNFGQHAAITCGVAQARGEYILVMDCDLQDDPAYIKDMLDAARNGNDVVFTRKKSREHSWFKDLSARGFNIVFNWLLDNKSIRGDDNVGSYSLITRKVADAFLNYGDYRRHYLAVLRWLGFQQIYIDIEHRERHSGKSSYTLKKLINHAIDGITWQSNKLLRLVVLFGMGLSFFSVLTGLAIIIRSIFNPFAAGWASTIVLILFSTGILMASIGITGIYIGNVFEQVKNRPLFVVDKTVNKAE